MAGALCEVCNISSAVTEQTLEAIQEVPRSSVSQEALSMVPSEGDQGCHWSVEEW